MAILNRFSAILLCCDSIHFLLLAAEFLAIPGLRFCEEDITIDKDFPSLRNPTTYLKKTKKHPKTKEVPFSK